MPSPSLLRRAFLALLALPFLLLALLLLSNFRGYRSRLIARLWRTTNYPVVVPPPPNFQPHVPPGFKVSVLAAGFQRPRWLAVSPNGDIFVADSAAGAVDVLRISPIPGEPVSRKIFADHLDLPFGIAFHDDYVYIANTNQVLRFRYDPKTSAKLGDAEPILSLPGMGYNQHWTRSLAFTPDGLHLFISVGSSSNLSIESDPRRAAILIADPDGKNMHIYASGLRNPVGIACNPQSGDLWVAVNERDDISDDLPPDFFTHVIPGGFYGYPYSYIGNTSIIASPHDPTWSQKPSRLTFFSALMSLLFNLFFMKAHNSLPTIPTAPLFPTRFLESLHSQRLPGRLHSVQEWRSFR